MNLPSYDTFKPHYSRVSGDGDGVLHELGGTVSTLAVRNACAIRICYCLNKTGKKIPENPPGVYGHIKQDKDGDNYICGTLGLKRYLLEVISANPVRLDSPAGKFKDKFAREKGLVFMRVTSPDNS